MRANFGSRADFKYAQFHSITNFQNAMLPKYIDLSYVNNIKEEIDFTTSIIKDENKICKINLINSNIDKIKFRYSRFKLHFPNNTDPEIKTYVYEKLLNKTAKEGFILSYEKLDKEYKEFIYLESGKYSKSYGQVVNWVSNIWWDYGYNKLLIFRNSLILFLFFYIINSIFYKSMICKVYIIEDFKKLKEKYKNRTLINLLRVLLTSIFYTSFIFFGIKFSLKNLKIKENIYSWNFLLLLNFFAQYILGLICLAYMANFIITT